MGYSISNGKKSVTINQAKADISIDSKYFAFYKEFHSKLESRWHDFIESVKTEHVFFKHGIVNFILILNHRIT